MRRREFLKFGTLAAVGSAIRIPESTLRLGNPLMPGWLTLAEVRFLEERHFSKEEIADVFSVPAALIGPIERFETKHLNIWVNSAS
jgi:hypothetical protein